MSAALALLLAAALPAAAGDDLDKLLAGYCSKLKEVDAACRPRAEQLAGGSRCGKIKQVTPEVADAVLKEAKDRGLSPDELFARLGGACNAYIEPRVIAHLKEQRWRIGSIPLEGDCYDDPKQKACMRDMYAGGGALAIDYDRRLRHFDPQTKETVVVEPSVRARLERGPGGTALTDIQGMKVERELLFKKMLLPISEIRTTGDDQAVTVQEVPVLGSLTKRRKKNPITGGP